MLKPKKYQVLEFDKKDKSRFWLNLKMKDPKTNKIVPRGRVKVQVDVLPASVATKNPVGKARDNPNHSPTLPQPEGRFELSLNPLKMYQQMIGPEIRAKIRNYLILAVCCFLCLYMIPGILSTIIGQGIGKLF